MEVISPENLQHYSHLDTIRDRSFIAGERYEDISNLYFVRCNLTGVDLRLANLSHTTFCACITTEMDITGANLYYTKFLRSVADERSLYIPDDVIGFPKAPQVPGLEEQIYSRIVRAKRLQRDCPLSMETWHTCKTVHCLAGWAIHLAGRAGYALSEKTWPGLAGALIYQESCGFVPNFFEYNTNKAIRDLESRLGIYVSKESKIINETKRIARMFAVWDLSQKNRGVRHSYFLSTPCGLLYA